MQSNDSDDFVSLVLLRYLVSAVFVNMIVILLEAMPAFGIVSVIFCRLSTANC